MAGNDCREISCVQPASEYMMEAMAVYQSVSDKPPHFFLRLANRAKERKRRKKREKGEKLAYVVARALVPACGVKLDADVMAPAVDADQILGHAF